MENKEIEETLQNLGEIKIAKLELKKDAPLKDFTAYKKIKNYIEQLEQENKKLKVKAISKPPRTINGFIGLCPNCGARVYCYEKNCNNCDQRLDWDLWPKIRLN